MTGKVSRRPTSSNPQPKTNLKNTTKIKLFWFIVKHNNLLKIVGIFGFKRSFAASKIDILVHKLLENKKNGFYVEIGANNGIDQSNTKYLETYFGWKGLLIEPINSVFKDLVKNRSTKNCFYNVACVNFNYPKTTMLMSYANLMSIGLEGENFLSDPRSHSNEGASFLVERDYVQDVTVGVRTLNSILLEMRAPHEIDFFSLDVEGAELEVLKGIDFNIFSFKVICIEIFEPYVESMTLFLTEKNYTLIKKITKHDYIFVNKNMMTKFKIT